MSFSELQYSEEGTPYLGMTDVIDDAALEAVGLKERLHSVDISQRVTRPQVDQIKKLNIT